MLDLKWIQPFGRHRTIINRVARKTRTDPSHVSRVFHGKKISARVLAAIQAEAELMEQEIRNKAAAASEPAERK